MKMTEKLDLLPLFQYAEEQEKKEKAEAENEGSIRRSPEGASSSYARTLSDLASYENDPGSFMNSGLKGLSHRELGEDSDMEEDSEVEEVEEVVGVSVRAVIDAMKARTERPDSLAYLASWAPRYPGLEEQSIAYNGGSGEEE